MAFVDSEFLISMSDLPHFFVHRLNINLHGAA